MRAPLSPTEPIDWHVGDHPVDYAHAHAIMQSRAAAIAEGRARQLIWLVEHSALYTAGTSARAADLLTPDRFPVHLVGRGGQYTYHGPGQRVIYVILDVRRRGGDVRAFVCDLEGWLIDTLAQFNVSGETRPGRVGVWVRRPDRGAGREDKIAALGIRIRHGVSFHGASLNVDPDLAHFDGIVPCGIRDHGVTSLADLGMPVTMAMVDSALRRTFEARFGATELVAELAPSIP